MNLLSAFAIFFIIWWTVLFTTLPIGVRTQEEEGERHLGTDAGAPIHARLKFKMLLTTAISGVVFGIFYYFSIVLGLSVDDFPRIVPDFSSR